MPRTPKDSLGESAQVGATSMRRGAVTRVSSTRTIKIARAQETSATRNGVPQEVLDEIIREMEVGSSLRSCCAKEGRPSIWSFLRMLDKDQRLAQQYARAREIQADYLAAECVEISDNDSDPQRARVRVDARKWYASKLKPKTYGDKLDVTTTAVVYTPEQAAAKRAEIAEEKRRLLEGCK